MALSTDYTLFTGAEIPRPNRSRIVNYDDAHTAATNAANELEALQATDFWLELPAEAQIALSRAHGILIGMVSAMETAGLV